MNEKTGTLYLCATPIGNLEDITLRVLRILKEVDVIAAEDTRHTLKLLTHFGISKPLISCHEHNQKKAGQAIITRLEQGENVAMVSDAGMPGISDPGEELVKDCVAKGLHVTVLPGASAGLMALVLSALPARRFVFEGFLPKEKKERRERLAVLATETRTMVLYESPHHVVQTLKELYDKLGDRQVAIARELTKIYEEVNRTTLQKAVQAIEEKGARGEYVLVVAGCAEKASDCSEWTIAEQVLCYMAEGLPKKEALKRVAKERNLPKSEIYNQLLDIAEKQN